MTDPDTFDEIAQLIFHFESREELVTGVSMLDSAILDDPDDMMLRMYRAHALLMMDRPEEALAEGELARETLPELFYLHNLLGHAYWRLGKRYMAQQSFEKAIELDRTDSQVLSDFALFMVMERGAKLGHEAAERAVKFDAESSDAWLALAISQHRHHQMDLFESSIRRSLDLDSGNPQARILLLERLQQKGESKQAEGLGKLMMEDEATRQAAVELFKKKSRQERVKKVVENSKLNNIVEGPSEEVPSAVQKAERGQVWALCLAIAVIMVLYLATR